MRGGLLFSRIATRPAETQMGLFSGPRLRHEVPTLNPDLSSTDTFTRRHGPPSSLRFASDSVNASPPQTAEALISRLVRNTGATPGFENKVRELLRTTLPQPILRQIVADGYCLRVQDHITQGRPELTEKQNYLNQGGGFNEPAAKQTTIAEKVLITMDKQTRWEDSVFWQNAVIHELGHVIADLMARKRTGALTDPDDATATLKTSLLGWGISEAPAFKEAWQKDYEALPKNLKGSDSPIAYYLNPDYEGGFNVGRRETFAEAFDVLLRGKESTFNYNHFRTHFSNTLQATRNLLQEAYGILLPT